MLLMPQLVKNKVCRRCKSHLRFHYVILLKWATFTYYVFFLHKKWDVFFASFSWRLMSWIFCIFWHVFKLRNALPFDFTVASRPISDTRSTRRCRRWFAGWHVTYVINFRLHKFEDVYLDSSVNRISNILIEM